MVAVTQIRDLDSQRKKDLSQCFAGTGLNQSYLRCHPAWRVSAPSSLRTFIRGPLFTEGQLRLTYSVALSARPRKAIPFRFPAAFPPSAALCKVRYGKYFSSSTVYQSIAYASSSAQYLPLFFLCSEQITGLLFRNRHIGAAGNSLIHEQLILDFWLSAQYYCAERKLNCISHNLFVLLPFERSLAHGTDCQRICRLD